MGDNSKEEENRQGERGGERKRWVEKGKEEEREGIQEERWSKGENSMREENTEDNDFRRRRQRGRGE